MADKKVIIDKDINKERLKELKAKPVLTPQETKEVLNRILEHLGVK